MARWVAIFEDQPRELSEDVRKTFAQAHFDYLQQHSDRILIGGGLRPDPDAWYCGGLWVLDVETRADAVELVEQDPFFAQGLRKGYQLFVWGKAPFYGPIAL